jgi:predicted O-methyltransferase YrrM
VPNASEPIRDYEQIRARVEAVEGFMVPGQERYLFEKVRSLPDDAVILEIGSYKGRSTVAMGYACVGTRRRIYCVDTWDGNDKDFPERNFFQIWEGNVNANALREYVVPLKGLSHDVLRRWQELADGRPVDFAFIDGSHEYGDVLEDLRLTWPLVKSGDGWIGFHDVHHTWPGPKRVWFDVAKRSLVEHEYASTLACGRKPAEGALAEPSGRSTAAEARPSADGGPAVHFVTTVTDRAPFLSHTLEQLTQLPFRWHWHVVDGGRDDRWDAVQRDHPENVTVYRKLRGQAWDGALEMLAMPLWALGEECLLWRIDPEEMWTAEQWIAGRRLFMENPRTTAAFYWAWIFVAPGLVTSTRHCYGNDGRTQWLRTWRFRPGMWWANKDAPVLAEPLTDGQWQAVHAVNPFSHDQTEAAGLVVQRAALVNEEQVRAEAARRGMPADEVVERWRALQRTETLPVKLRDFLPWVKDDTEVDRAENYVAGPLARASV